MKSIYLLLQNKWNEGREDSLFLKMRKNLAVAFLVVLLAGGYFPVSAQQFLARRMPFLNQLPSKEVSTLYQDKKGFIWVGTTQGLGRYDGYDLQMFRSDYRTPELLLNNYVRCITESEEYICVGTRNGLNLLDKSSFRVIPSPRKEFLHTDIKHLFTDRSGFVWIATQKSLYRCDAKLSPLQSYPLGSPGDCQVVSLYQDQKDDIWVMTWGSGLFKYDKNKDTFTSFPQIGTQNIPFAMYQDRQGRYWLGTWGEGLYRFYPEAPAGKCYVRQRISTSSQDFDASIFFDFVQDDFQGYLWTMTYHELCALKPSAEGVLEKVDVSTLVDVRRMYSKILKDRDGTLWLGAYDAGFNLLTEKAKIQNYPLQLIKKQTGLDPNISCIQEDEDGIIWLNQERGGLAFYDRKSGEVGINQTRVGGFMEIDRIVESRERNQMWISSSFQPLVLRAFRQGMNLYVKDSVILTDYCRQPGLVTELLEDRKGNVWIATTEQFFLRPAGRDTLFTLSSSFSRISGIAEDTAGRIWVTSAKGLFGICFNGTVKKEVHYPLPPFCAALDKMEHLCVDPNNALWISTSLGMLLKFDPVEKEMCNYTADCSLSGDVILNLFSGPKELWVVTPRSIVLYRPDHGNTVRYSTSDEEIGVSAFRNRGAFLSRSGILYAGGHGGFLSVGREGDQKTPVHEKKVEITDVKVNSWSLFFADSLREGFANSVTQVYLSSGDRNLEISFSGLDFFVGKNRRYAYKLEGVDQEWVIPEKDRHTAFYNQLGKGEYIFKVRMSNEAGEWGNEFTALHITKAPAWFETWYAYLAYTVLGLGVAVLIFWYSLYRMKRKNAIRFQEELTRTKLDYFTNVSHELLTPLTILSCLTDELEREEPPSRNFVVSMRDNVNRLKKLIRQVLDFRKTESGKMELKVQYGALSGFIRTVGDSNFSALAQQKQIQFTTHLQPDEFSGYFDADKLDAILFNLLSNAIKYTPEGGKAGLDASVEEGASGRFVQIRVWDKGVGISPQEQEQIFTRFYTGSNHRPGESNGIGLSLTKELIRLHHGTISVESQPGEGSCFIVSLPIDRANYTEEECGEGVLSGYEAEIDLLGSSTEISQDVPLVLIVDDNPELLELIRKMFSRSYRVLTARDGMQALEALRAHPVDLVVCDVMMPGMNGLEFCTQVKNDLTISHIPVLMLTAKNTDEDRVACYEAGADGYVAKPFEVKVLQARVNNLLQLHKQRQQKFRGEPELHVSELEYRFADERFLNDLVACVEMHLEEPDFDLEQLAAELNVSKSTMNRKIKAMVGLTPMDFVKNIKLKCACKMLHNPSITVSEVAYAMGFSTPKYFTKCFKDEFGMTPSHYQQSLPAPENSL